MPRYSFFTSLHVLQLFTQSLAPIQLSWVGPGANPDARFAGPTTYLVFKNQTANAQVAAEGNTKKGTEKGTIIAPCIAGGPYKTKVTTAGPHTQKKENTKLSTKPLQPL